MSETNTYDLLTITGPTASGKTTLAVAVAEALNGEIISADSRQVYRAMDIGTGKDLGEYHFRGKEIPYHLIDICDAGDKYNVYEYQHDFHRVYTDIKTREKLPILCGGTGMYIEAVLKGFRLLSVPENIQLRNRLAGKSISELKIILEQLQPLHNTTDLDSAKRAIRAIEIAEYTMQNSAAANEFPPLKSLTFVVDSDRDLRRTKITERLKARLEEGMIEEMKNLLGTGISADDLIYYGLEYKFVTLYLTGRLTYNEMFTQLEIAIHQFAKRQMTWFRGMERRGFTLNWLDAHLSIEEKVNIILSKLQR